MKLSKLWIKCSIIEESTEIKNDLLRQ